MPKPYIICHMLSSIDGKILTAHWNATGVMDTVSDLYEKCHESFNADAWLLGRVSLEKDFSKGEKPELIAPVKPIKRIPFIGNEDASSFAIAVDIRGTLGWKSNEIGGDHIIYILTENISDEYLYYLQRKKISYVFAGKDQPDFRQALQQITELFPIKTIMLEGGGLLNGTFLKDGLIDEISLLLVPVVDGSYHTSTTFDAIADNAKNTATPLTLIKTETLEKGVLWLRYKTKTV